MEIISVRIKEIRTERNLTQKEFGDILSVSQDTVSLWEKGKSVPTTEFVVSICKKFGLSADYVLGWEV